MNAHRIGGVIYALWYRETVRFLRDRSRWMGMVLQPVLYLLLVGYGIADSMRFRGAPVDYVTFMYPGMIGMSILFTAMLAGGGIIMDREFGFLKEVLVAPVPRWGLAFGKALGIATIVLVQTAVLLVLAPIAHVQITVAAAAAVLGISALLGFSLGSLGVLIGARLQSMEGFNMVMGLLTMPLFFLSGAFYPVKGLPMWLSALAHVDPLTYGIDALRNVLYMAGLAARSLVQYGTGTDLAITACVAVGLSLLGAWSFEART